MTRTLQSSAQLIQLKHTRINLFAHLSAQPFHMPSVQGSWLKNPRAPRLRPHIVAALVAASTPPLSPAPPPAAQVPLHTGEKRQSILASPRTRASTARKGKNPRHRRDHAAAGTQPCLAPRQPASKTSQGLRSRNGVERKSLER